MTYRSMVISALRKRVDTDIQKPGRFMTPDKFQRQSIALWAGKEAIRRLENSDEDAEYILEKFKKEMEDYSYRNYKTSHMFVTAYEIAEWMIDILLSFEEVYS